MFFYCTIEHLTHTMQLLCIVHLNPLEITTQVYIKQQQTDSVSTHTHSHSSGGSKAGLVNLILQLQNMCLLAMLTCQS